LKAAFIAVIRACFSKKRMFLLTQPEKALETRLFCVLAVF